MVKAVKSALTRLRRSRSRCSSSISSGSYMLRRPPSRFCTASITSANTCTSCVFFLPTIMGSIRWKCTSVMSSFSDGWKKACLMLEKMMSRRSSLLGVL